MNQAGNAITIDTAGQAVEFRRIEIGQTHPNPGSGVCARSQTEAVAVPDVAKIPAKVSPSRAGRRASQGSAWAAVGASRRPARIRSHFIGTA